MCETNFFICESCKSIVRVISDSGTPMTHCNEKMIPLEPRTTREGAEKHLPVVKVNADSVKIEIGAVTHPMTEDHHIEWIYLQTDKGAHTRYLKTDDRPEAHFCLTDEKPIAAFAYCNIHGLCKTSF